MDADRDGRNGQVTAALPICWRSLPDGALVLIELKRDRTPREVVAQALDYACWVEKLEAEDIAAIYSASRLAAIWQPISRLNSANRSTRSSSTTSMRS